MDEMFGEYIFDAQFHKPRYFDCSQTITRQLLILLMDKAPVFMGNSGYSHLPIILREVSHIF